MDELNALLSNLPGYDLITSAMKLRALESARVPDSEGRWPNESGYVPSYDVYFAALSLVSFLKAQPVLRSSSSEGTSVSVDAPDWAALVTYYRTQSPIIGTQGNSVLQEVAIPGRPHVYKTDMSGRGGYYGDIDTDVG